MQPLHNWEEDEPLLLFRDNNQSHNDIHLRIGEYRRVADSYYLKFAFGDRGSSGTVERVLVALLGKWLEALEFAGESREVFLPFDFQDECTCGLRCEPTGDGVSIQPARSSREAYTVDICDPAELFFEIDGLTLMPAPPINMAREDLIAKIRGSIAHAQNTSWKSAGRYQSAIQYVRYFSHP